MNFADVLRWACVLLLAGIGTWFARVVGHFDKRSPRRPLLAVLLAVSLATGLATLITVARASSTPAGRSCGAAILAVIAALIFRSALRATRHKSLSLAFSRATPPILVQSGPYRFVRHPLYTAYGIFWFACALLSATWLITALVAVLVALYVAAARMEERDIMGSELGPEYKAYRTRTGILLPNPFGRARRP